MIQMPIEPERPNCSGIVEALVQLGPKSIGSQFNEATLDALELHELDDVLGAEYWVGVVDATDVQGRH